MPGALPVRRIRRDAARPSVERGNAVNSIVAMWATPSWVCGLPGLVPVVRDGQARRACEMCVPRKALNSNRILLLRRIGTLERGQRAGRGRARFSPGTPVFDVDVMLGEIA